MSEKIVIHYDHTIVYSNEDLNAIGATLSTTLRAIIPPTAATTKYVAKFGNAYTITDITAGSILTPRSDGGGVNKWWYEFYDFDTHTLMATLKDENGVSTFVDGAALLSSASAIYIKVVWKSGTVAIQNNDGLSIDTDIDPGGRIVRLSAESFTSGEFLFYFAYSGSSYYMDDINDDSAMYGGYRGTGNGTLRRPYFNIQDGIDAVAAAGAPFDNVTVLCDCDYDEDIDIDVASITVQAALGKKPRITRGIGARVTREVEHDGNNADTAYVSKTGDDADPGTYQEPYLTIGAAFAGIGARTSINIKDAENYDEALIFNAAITVEPIYGMLPEISPTSGVVNIISITHAAVNIHGFTMNGNYLSNYGIKMSVTYTGNITDNTIFQFKIVPIDLSGAPISFNGNIKRNHIYGGTFSGLHIGGLANHAGTVSENRIHNSRVGFSLGDDGASDISMIIKNNIIYLNSFEGINFAAGTFSGNMENNTVTQNPTGVYGAFVVAFTGNFRNMIVYNNSTVDIFLHALSIPATITESNYGTNSGWTIGAGNITTDPEFCNIDSPLEFGISANSGAYRTDTSSDDMGAHLRIIEYNASTIELNGFLIDGQGIYNNGLYIVDSVNHIDCSLKWCTLYNFQGIGIDPYDDDTDTAFTISNCIIRDNGNGIKLSYGGNILQENIIYNNTIFGIWADYTGQIIDHNIIYNNKYGLYLESNSASLSIKNSTFYMNILYDIYSESTNDIPVLNCCTGGELSVIGVDISNSSNIIVNPLFQDIDTEPYDFHIRTKETDSVYESLCKNAADDGYDIGAYLVSRSVENDFWKMYTLAYNPTRINFANNAKGLVKLENGIGSLLLWAKGFKRMFTLSYSDRAASTSILRKKLEYFVTRIQKRVGNISEELSKFRISFLPSAKLKTGTGTVTAIEGTTNKMLTDASANLVEDELRSFNTAIIFEAGSGVVEPISNTVLVAGAGWTINEHAGFIYKHPNGNFYYILANTVDTLLVSDPLETLVAGTFTYSIEKYFKITENDTGDYILEDDDNELSAGSYSYYVDFITTKIAKTKFNYNQKLFDYTQEISKTGYGMTMEED